MQWEAGAAATRAAGGLHICPQEGPPYPDMRRKNLQQPPHWFLSGKGAWPKDPLSQMDSQLSKGLSSTADRHS